MSAPVEKPTLTALVTDDRPRSIDPVLGIPDWAPSHTVYIGWPARKDVWREGARPARAAIAVLARAVANFAPVCIVSTKDAGSYAEAVQEFKADRANIRVEAVEMDDCWIRDTGPVYASAKSTAAASSSNDTQDLAVVGVSFDFNAWGGSADGCYGNFERDRRVGPAIAALGKVPCESSSVVLEGGSISCDGNGTIITTTECLLHGNRNRGATADLMEMILRDTLGARKVVWLPFGAARDSDTNGHVDNMCVFVGPSTVLLHWADKAVDAEQHRRSVAALRVLKVTTDADGNRFVIHKVHAPSSPIVRTEHEAAGVVTGQGGAWAKPRAAGEQLAASYVNALFVDKVVIIPAFGVNPADDILAENEIQAAVGPSRKVIPVPAREFVLGGGGIHCLTVSQPLTCGL
jgi:agmatine deiminase